jgi:hypothetical protein
MKLRLNKSFLIGLLIAFIALLILWIYNSAYKAQELPIQIGLYVMYGLLILAIIAAIALFSKGFQLSGWSKISIYVLSLLLFLLVLGYALDAGELNPEYLKYGIDTVFGESRIGLNSIISLAMIIIHNAGFILVFKTLKHFNNVTRVLANSSIAQVVTRRTIVFV